MDKNIVSADSLNFAHLGTAVHFADKHLASLNGSILIRISHEKRFRTGTFLGLATNESYRRDLANGEYFVQQSGAFLPLGSTVQIESQQELARPESGTAGASVHEHVGKEAYLKGKEPWRRHPSAIIEHHIGEGTSFIYEDSDGMLDPDVFSPEDVIGLS